MPFVGDGIIVTAKWAVNGALTDPTTITFKWSFGGQGATDNTWIYGTSGLITRVQAGWYQAQITATAPGIAIYQWTGTGAAQGSGVSTEDISPLPLI